MIDVDSLNPPQKEAVTHTEGPLLVLAGAGTGKTKVLTTRLAYILTEGLAFPNEILAVTFTNKAAKEMVERVERLIGQSAAGLWLGTFHALGARLLRTHPEAAGLESGFTILNPDDQQRVVDEIIKGMGIGFDSERFPPRLVVNIISRWKDNAWTPDDVPKDEDGAGGRLIEVYRQYQDRLTALNACDFGDLLLKMLVMFKNHPDLLAKYQNQFKYVMVDEYQDTNTVQYLWLRLMVMTHKNLCVVGDDDQSIYAWRGAQVGNILQFEKHYPGAKSVRLEQNYRSKGHILKTASGLIAKNSERHGKTLWTEDDDGEKIDIHPMMDDREEARFIADYIEKNQRDGKPWGDHAILVRTSAQTRSIEERFMKQAVPYQLIGLLKFYERKEIRDALAYLRLVHSSSDDLAFQRIVNVPKRGVGDASVLEIQRSAQENGIPLFEGCKLALERGELPTRVANQLRPFVEQVESWRMRMGTVQLDEILEKILEESGYFQMLRDDKNKEEARGRLENLKELLRACQEYADVASFLEKVSLATDGDEEETDTVKVMTVHGAKGLEFDTVFIPGFEEGIFPHQRSLNEEGKKGLEEERRLAYVALTRAQRKAILSYAMSRRMYGSFESCMASRFIEEMPKDSVKIMPATRGGGNQSYGSNFGFRPNVGSTYDKRWQGGGSAASRPEPLVQVKKVSEEGFATGQRIFHQKFGYGKIVQLEGSGAQQRYVINFDKAGQKKLVAGLAKLEAA